VNFDGVFEPDYMMGKEELQPVYLPASTLSALQKEFGLTPDQAIKSIQQIVQKAIEERIAENNSNVFTEAETKDLEEDLKGLGYI
jgi:hypothetical protein